MLEILDVFLKVILLFCSTVYLYNSIIRLKKGDRAFQYYFYLLYYFFYILPIIIGMVSPNHQYTSFWKANEAMDHGGANVIYDLFAIIFMFVIMRSARRSVAITTYNLTYNRTLIRCCTVVMMVAFAITIITNDVGSLLGYASGYLDNSLNISESLIGCGTISYLILLGHRKNISKIHLFFITLILGSFFWIVGKRYIIAETVIMCIYVLSITGQIESKKFFRYLITGGVGIIVFCIIYGIALKGNFNSFVDYFLVDMSRQYTLVYQFYCEIIGREISVNQFDAIVYIILFWVPRIIWRYKPYPFVNQLTYSLISSSNTPTSINVGWATTCSIFSDLFDSFSYLGIIITFMLFTYLFKKINTSSRPHYKILLMYFSVRLLTVQLSSFIIQVVVCFIIIFLCDKFGINRRKDNID